MKRLIYLILLLFGLSGCKTEQQEVQNPIVVDTDFVLQENYYGGAMQWEPNDRDSMTEEQWDRLFSRIYETGVYSLLHNALFLLFRL